MRAPDAYVEEGIGRERRCWQDDLKVAAAKRHSTSILRFIQGECGKHASHLSGQEGLALGPNDSADLFAPFANDSPVNLITSDRSGCTGSR